MPRAVILNTASAAGITGGTFNTPLVANSGDALIVPTFSDGGARVLEAWAGDSDSVMEIQVIYSRQSSTHDQAIGFRQNVPAAAFGGAATNGAFPVLDGFADIEVFSADTPQINVSATTSDDCAYSWVTEYDNLAGGTTNFIGMDYWKQHRKSTLGLRCAPVANTSTPGLYGTARGLTADDANRLHAGAWYAIAGFTVQTQVFTIALSGADWGGYRLGAPAGSVYLRSNTWFIDQSAKWGKNMIPCFQGLNGPGINVFCVDLETSTSPKVDFLLYELDGPPPSGG